MFKRNLTSKVLLYGEVQKLYRVDVKLFQDVSWSDEMLEEFLQELHTKIDCHLHRHNFRINHGH